MRYKLAIGILSITPLLFVRCGEAPKEEHEGTVELRTDAKADEATAAAAVWSKERETATTELRSLRDDIEERILDVENRLKRTDLSASERKAIEEERATLIDLRKRIDGSIAEVEGSDQSTWQDIKEGVNNTTRDVRDWFKKLGENVDKETKADADKDGH